jgi:cardiolipin synthase A/B
MTDNEVIPSSAGFRLISTVDEMLEKMLAAIREAQSSIRMEMYIYTASPIGESFRDALAEAAQRGVSVRVLIDALGSLTLPDKFWSPLIEAGGQFRWFNPLRLRFWTFRNHRKLLVCDDTKAFIGGFNISTEYQGDGIHKGWHDLGVQISGRISMELAGSFDELFSLADFQYKRFATLRRTTHRRIISTLDGQIILNGPGRGVNYYIRALLSDLKQAQSVQIICAYFLPTRAVRRALIKAARRGSRVQLILPGKSDVLVSQLACRRLYTPLLHAGVEIFEYQPQILHSKLFIMDDVVYSGSANLEPRSFYIDYELMVRFSRPDILQDAQVSFEAALRHSEQIHATTWSRSRSLWRKIVERCAYFLLARIDPYVAEFQWKSLKLAIRSEKAASRAGMLLRDVNKSST